MFAHFGSKTGLDLALVDAAADRFDRQVVAPAAAAPSGVARLVGARRSLAGTGRGATTRRWHLLTAACPPALPAPRRRHPGWRRPGDRARAAGAAAVAGGELASTRRPTLVAFELDALLHRRLRDADAATPPAAGRARYAIEHLLRRCPPIPTHPRPPAHEDRHLERERHPRPPGPAARVAGRRAARRRLPAGDQGVARSAALRAARPRATTGPAGTARRATRASACSSPSRSGRRAAGVLASAVRLRAAGDLDRGRLRPRARS